MLSQVKTQPPACKVKGVVYKVDCTCGSTYIGETRRSLEVRLKEHRRAVRMDHDNNGIAVHANNTFHDIKWGSAQVIERETNWYKRKVKEAQWIKGTKDSINLDQGLILNATWSTLETA